MAEKLFKIKTTKSFLLSSIKFFEKKELEKLENFKLRLESNPYLGDSLRVPYVREFRLNNGKRAYFLVYDELKIILFVSMSNKKSQKETINTIFKNIKEFKEYAYLNYE